MNPYRQEKTEIKDDYYEEKSREAIRSAYEEAIKAGKTPEEIRSAIRRSYPFGPLRKNREYKIWNRLALQAERELGLPVRKHKQTQMMLEQRKENGDDNSE